jgi:pimeloyl-ACP methyl ester carboxylesterase
MTAIVLVHGLWADGSCWSETITELRALGYDPVAAQLPLQSMRDDIAAVQRVPSSFESRESVLLVGWSAGRTAVR